jgi:hypothetical protein
MAVRPTITKVIPVYKKIDLDFMRPLQRKYLHDNLFASIDKSVLTNDRRITMVPAGTNAGKSTVITKITIPTMIERDSKASTIIFTSPDSGCVQGPYKKFKIEWDGKQIKCNDGTVKTIRAMNKDEVNLAFKAKTDSASDIVEVWFVSTQWLRGIFGEYYDKNYAIVRDFANIGIPVPDYVIVDEIHFGMGTINRDTIFHDQGRNNKNFDPKWLPTIFGMAVAGARIIGYTGTATLSQRGGTTLGADVFISIDKMPENKNTSVFAEVCPVVPEISANYISQDVANVYELSKINYESMVIKCLGFFRDIDKDTWDKASKVDIVPIMVGGFFKFGRVDATKSVPLNHNPYSTQKRGKKANFYNYMLGLRGDAGVTTSDEKVYATYNKTKAKFDSHFYENAYSVIESANWQPNTMRPLGVAVNMLGNMGWDIPRIKQIAFLGYPSAKNVHLMQLQTMARAKRLVCGVYDHTDKAKQIAELDISKEQKVLLAKYVVFVNTAHVVFSDYVPLLNKAYSEFRKDMHTPAEGLELYLNIIETHVPVNKNNVTKLNRTKAPRYAEGYIAGSLNQTYKKHHCEACMAAGSIDSTTGKTLCEVSARKVREFERGTVFSDIEWDDTWFHTLALDHKNGNRNDYSPDNLITRCPTNNGVKTYDSKDYLGKYDDDGNKVSNG